MTETPRIDRAERLIQATPEAIHRAFVDPAALVRWLPPDGMTGEIVAWDPRPGGAFRIALHYDEAEHATGKTSAHTDVAQGHFLEVGARRIVQRISFESDDPSFAGAMTMTWSFDPVAGGTEVRIACADVPPGISPADHAEGLAASLANLAAFVELSEGRPR